MTPLASIDARPILPSPERSLAAARAQDAGEVFESLLDFVHQAYLRDGRAALYHNRIGGKFIGKDKFIPVGREARPDYSGTIKGGISVHFDAKTTSDVKSWRLPSDRQHQYTMLLDQATMGALAFFLVECRPMQAVYLLRVHPSIPVVDDRPEIFFDTRTPAVGGPDCHQGAPVFCLAANDGGMYDWLAAVERIWLPVLHNVGFVQPVRSTKRRNGYQQRYDHVAQRNKLAVQRYRDGESLRAIANDMHISEDYFQHILNKAGIKFRRGRKPGTVYAPRQEQPLKTLAGVHQGHIPDGVRLRTREEPLDPPILEDHGCKRKGKSK